MVWQLLRPGQIHPSGGEDRDGPYDRQRHPQLPPSAESTKHTGHCGPLPVPGLCASEHRKIFLRPLLSTHAVRRPAWRVARAPATCAGRQTIDVLRRILVMSPALLSLKTRSLGFEQSIESIGWINI